jgi:isoleucyl-tRNA synthetase
MTEPNPPAPKRSYKETLNLPQTSFAMKANLVQREPQFEQRWEKLGVYHKLREQNAGKPRFLLHDGPPYANGNIHLGHLLNKVLKDLVVRSRNMLGFDAPFVPGWDCHGLPIEHKVMKDLGSKARSMSPSQIRQQCAADANKFIELQKAQMLRLGTLGDYAHPYKTMAPEFEAGTLEVFAELVKTGLVYRSLKPVHWSIENRTALAEAELEYQEREDTSVYVMFPVVNPQDLPLSLNARPGPPINLMIWTTTPWTLPANLAVAAAPNAEYALWHVEANGREAAVLIARDLGKKVLGMIENASFTLTGACTGAQLEAAGIKYNHPFIDRVSPLVTAPYVTLEDGTGLVHTAPGHGTEDYQTGLRYGLEIYCPVQENGTFDDTAPDWLRGVRVWDANEKVVEHLRESGHLFHDNKFMHSYPHDWRSKTPVIFRATEQWFLGVDEPFSTSIDLIGLVPKCLRNRAEDFVIDGKFSDKTVWDLLKAQERYTSSKIDGAGLVSVDEPGGKEFLAEVTYQEDRKNKIQFIPEWGRNRMRGMLESRPDWCLSRQRAWGLPIPAFFGPEKGQTLLTAASVRAVAKKFREHGSDLWFTATPAELLADYKPATDPDAPDWIQSKFENLKSEIRKGSDTFDVWFESGSSWNSVLRQCGLGYPADLYLEGSDQHRGWFQHSLLPALGVTGQPPFKSILTHGFIVDKHGKKMSKSEGNAIEVEALLRDYGADVCRWWVASLNTDNDIKADLEFFRLAGEEYRKVRNTIRFLLSNLSDFKPQDFDQLHDDAGGNLNGWVLEALHSLVVAVRKAYENFQFATAQTLLFNFCNGTLSAVYLSTVKDRLYCDKADSYRRRQTQAAMYKIVNDLCLLMAPILPHTADEAWQALHGENAACIHLELFPKDLSGDYGSIALAGNLNWGNVMSVRDVVLKEIENFRQQANVTNPLELGVVLSRQRVGNILLELDPVDAADLLGVSRVTEKPDGPNEILDLRTEPRCERSWKRDGTVKIRSDGGYLSDRDAAALGLA